MNNFRLLSMLALVFAFMSCTSSSKDALVFTDTQNLNDNNLETYFIGDTCKSVLELTSTLSEPIRSYGIYSSGREPKHDASSWTLQGTNDGSKWVDVDARNNQKFCSRYQEILCEVAEPKAYKKYRLYVNTLSTDTLIIPEVKIYSKASDKKWHNFKYPTIDFEVKSPNVEGAKIYSSLVQNADEYIKYHALKVAEILYFSDSDDINPVGNIQYTLEDREGISAKGGSAPNINIFYSTRHVEKSAHESMYKLDFETRGVLYHELTHGYQLEPKGCGSYGTNKTFWACIEGTADAVRAEAGYFDMSTRKPGGNWLDGYRTTGFFIQWLTTKDPDAIRKFNRTCSQLEVWSFDGAIKKIFGQEASIQQLWDEYQAFLINDAKK